MVTRFLAALVAFSFFFTVSLRAETIVVTTDDSGSNPEDGLTSLEEALVQANASLEETVLITFNIPDPNPETPAIDPILIVLNSPLRVQRPMTIDGTTQPGYVPGTPIIQITQNLAGGGEPDEQEPVVAQVFLVKSVSTFIIQFNLAPPPPLPEVAARAVARAVARVDGDGAVFRGLSITNSIENGLHFVDGSGHVVEGCFIGIEPDGDAAGNNFAGIFVGVDVEGIRIGTNSDGNNDVLERNVISSNGEDGIYVEGDVDRTFNTPGVAAAPVGNILIAGNYLGTGPDGIAVRGNGTEIEDGTGIYSEGTSVSILNNLIASNFIGIWIDEGDAVIQGNVIGLNSDGSALNGNEIGVYVEPNTAVLIGTDSDGTSDTAERNVISGNLVGIQAGDLDDFFLAASAELPANLPAAFGDPGELTIAGNYIGTTLNGAAAAIPVDLDVFDTDSFGVLANSWPGTLFIRNNVIGGTYIGIGAEFTFQTVIQGNLIGLNASGDAAVPTLGGIVLLDCFAAVIGTDGDGTYDAAERNVVSGNIIGGVVIEDFRSRRAPSTELENLAAVELPVGKRISGNYIGTNAAGTAAIGNGFLEGEPLQDFAGGILVISFDNILIGTDGDGSAGDAVEGNLISGNAPYAILNITSFEGSQQFPEEGGEQVIAGNIIGLNAAGTAALPNGSVFEGTEGPFSTASAIFSGNLNTRIGTNNDGVSDALESNVISGNIGNAITIFGFESADAQARAIPPAVDYPTTIAGNRIGTAADGTTPFGNSENGIIVIDVTRVLIGGTTAASGNVIANNGASGISVEENSFSITILSNSITNNTQLGIDLVAEGDGPDGITPNDAPITEGEFSFADPDFGPNSLTNTPILTTVSMDRKIVTGTLDGSTFSGETPATYIVQIFGNSAASMEEGQKLLGSVEVTLPDNAALPTPFTLTLQTPAAPGSFLTATATRAFDFAPPETSEFSAPISVPVLAFASGPSWTPEVPTTDDVVTFTAQPNMPGITVIWDFGDGTPTATGESVTHTFGTPGVYQVTVTLLDEPTGTAITQVITVTVIAGATPPKNTPSFRVRDLNIRLGGSEGNDSITIMGLLNVPKSTTFAGKTIDFDIGGVKESFELNAKGKSKPGAKNFKFGKVNKLRNQETTFNLTLKKATYEAILKSSAVKKDANGLPTELVVRVKFNGQETISIVPLRFRLLKIGATATFGRF